MPPPPLQKKKQNIYVCSSHGLFNANAVAILEESPVDTVFVTNSVPLPEGCKSKKIEQVRAHLSSCVAWCYRVCVCIAILFCCGSVYTFAEYVVLTRDHTRERSTPGFFPLVLQWVFFVCAAASCMYARLMHGKPLTHTLSLGYMLLFASARRCTSAGTWLG